MSWRSEFQKSIKSFDTEEKLDLYFYRPFGFLIAKIAKPLGLSPTHLTLIGLALGLSSGYFFYHNQESSHLIIASILFIMAGVFDSSDGQLARMGGKSTKLGLVLDGLCDNLVFSAVYISCTLTVPHFWGLEIWLVAVLAGICHSFQSSMLDYYNREYLYFGYGKIDSDYWNPTLEEAVMERANAKAGDKIFWRLRFSWLWQQNKLSNRNNETRYLWRKILKGEKSESFQNLYREHNRNILRAWRLLGPNFHTILILLSVFFRRFDLYLILADLILLNFALIFLRILQNSQDEKMIAQMKDRGIA